MHKTSTYKTVIHILILLLIAVVGYSNSLHNTFLLDDHVDLFSPEGAAHKTFRTVLIDPQGDIYRPFSHFFCFVAYKAFGANPFGYHVTNLILFIIIGLLFYAIFRRLTRHAGVSFLACLLFVAHPINQMMVNYISAIQICVYLIVTQLAFLFYLLGKERGSRVYGLLSLVFYACCLASHEMSYLFPFIVMGAAYFLYGTTAKEAARQAVFYFVLAVAYFVFRSLVFEIHAHYEGPKHILPHLGIYLSSYLELISWYASKLIVPLDILFLWAAQIDYRILNYQSLLYVAVELAPSPLALARYVLVFISMALPAYLVFFRWKRGLKAFLLSLFMLGMITVGYAGYVYFPMAKPIIEPHWFYFTSMGFFIGLAYLLLMAKSRMPALVWLMVVALLLFGYIASLRQHNTRWADQETYCRYWISLNKQNMTPYYWLVRTLMEREDYVGVAEAIEDGMKGVYTLDDRLAADLGYAYIQLGMTERGYGNLQYSASIGGVDYAPLHYYFGEYFLLKKDFKSAVNAYTVAIELDPYKDIYRDKLDFAQRSLDTQ